jgi:NADPH-dependent 2,4-dienoyl-CoA reductase/sulfur reductase-like enzyme
MIRATCDVLVVGGGPAGIAAASRAAELGARTLMIDEGLAPGGQIWRASHGGRQSASARRWVERLARSGAAIRSSTSVVDIEPADDRFRVVADAQGDVISIDAGAVVLATGARELFLPFPGWTLPNVFGVGGGQALMKSGMSVRGKRVVVAGTGPLVLAVAAAFASHGARVRVVAEQAPFQRVARFAASLWRSPSRAGQALALRARLGAAPRYLTGTWIARADGASRVESVTLTDGRTSRTIECDILCAAFGLLPNVELARFVGCAIGTDGAQVNDEQATSVDGIFCVGEPTGIGGVDLSLVEGEIGGTAAAGGSPSRGFRATRARLRREATLLAETFALRPELLTRATDDTIACRCEDVRFGALDRSWTFRQAKLYTRIGMGPCQGRICAAALECLWGWPREAPRPPIQPARVAALLGAADGASLT